MRKLCLEISEAAVSDLLEQADWYAAHANDQLATRWERAVTLTMMHILDYPDAAPVAAFKNPQLADVRRIPVEGFPRHLIFYRVAETTVQVIRVLHGARDLESLFS